MSAQGGRAAARRAFAAAGSFALALGLGAAGVVGAAGPASAHNVVVGTSPTSGSTVTEPPESVDVTFDDVVLDLSAEGSSTVVTVTDAGGTDHATGCPTTQDRTVSVPVALGEGGEYTVGWRIVSADGHPTSGEFSFTYDPPPGAEAAAPAADAAPCEPGGAAGVDDTSGGAADAAAGGASDAGAPAGDDGASELVVVLGIAGGVVALAGAAVLVALRLARRRG